MKPFDYYNSSLKMIFKAELHWDDTVTVKAIRTLKKNTFLKEFSYMAGGKQRLYLKADFKYNRRHIFIFKLNKGVLFSPSDACRFVAVNITNMRFE